MILAQLFFHYIWSGSQLIGETRGEEITIPQELSFTTGPRTVITYLYGVNGITGFTIAGIPFYYRKNIQDDITHIFDNDGILKAEYIYDAWGNCDVVLDVDGIGTLNAVRYRSYYLDNETGLYYLKSRYYDPETGRFISMDGIGYLEPGRVNGLNLYSYCGNNPVMFVDTEGSKFFTKLVGINTVSV